MWNTKIAQITKRKRGRTEPLPTYRTTEHFKIYINELRFTQSRLTNNSTYQDSTAQAPVFKQVHRSLITVISKAEEYDAIFY